jgi:hypothetical protein
MKNPEAVAPAIFDDTLLLTFLDELMPDAVIGSTVKVPPGTTPEFNDA